MLWLYFVSAIAAKPIEIGDRAQIYLNFGEEIRGRISSFSKSCITLRNANGDRSVDIRLIKTLTIDEQRYGREELPNLLQLDLKERATLPPNELLVTTGILNAGFPLWFVPEERDALGVTILDGIFLGAGIYSIQEEPIVALPIFLGLGGLRVWSITKSVSKANQLRKKNPSNLCQVIGQ